MNRTKIAYGGGRALGVKVLQWLSSQEIFDVVAVCPIPYKSDPEYHEAILNIINENHYRQCEIEELLDLDIDIGLSVNYHKIIREEILYHCRDGFYNVHHSYNMRLRGRNITTHVLLNTLRENVYYHGTSIHRMIPELDAGPIVASKSVEIENNDTAYSLFRKTDDAAFELVKEWLPRITMQKVFPYSPSDECVHTYRSIELPDKRIDMEGMTSEEINVHIRAFDFPGNEPAFTESDGVKKHIVLLPRDKYQTPIIIGERVYYTE